MIGRAELRAQGQPVNEPLEAELSRERYEAEHINVGKKSEPALPALAGASDRHSSYITGGGRRGVSSGVSVNRALALYLSSIGRSQFGISEIGPNTYNPSRSTRDLRMHIGVNGDTDAARE